MPEGPQVRRTGNLIAKWEGATVSDIRHPKSRKPWELDLPVVIESVSVKGKNIFIALSNGQVVFNHMLMWGSWQAGDEWRCRKPKRLNTLFQTDRGPLGYFGGGTIKLVSAAEAQALKDRLGPDMLDVQSADEAFALVRKSTLPVGEAVLAQSLVAGIGNIYKSEGLFAAGVHPLRRACDVTKAEWQSMWDMLAPQMRADVTAPPGITTTPPELQAVRIRNFVYRRSGQSCVRCQTKIQRIYQGDTLRRSTYFCPTCQPEQAS